MRWKWLFLVFLLVLATRLFFAFSTPYLSTDSAYLQYRLVDNILESGFPHRADSLSWGGSFIDISPVWSYILAFFSLLIGKTFAFKLIPNFFASLLVFPVFLIVFRSTDRYWFSVLASVVASFVPVFFGNTLNGASVVTLVIPLFFFLVYLWMRLPGSVVPFIFFLVFFAFLHPSSLLFVLGLLVFSFFCSIEKFRLSMASVEVLLFSCGFVLWAQFLLFKRAIVAHGLSVFWLNFPSGLLDSFFSQLGLFDVLWQVGFFPLVVGIYVIYRNIVREGSFDVYLIFSFVAVISVLLWLKLVEFLFGLMVLGVLLVILFAHGLSYFEFFVLSTKFSRLTGFFCALIAVTVVFTSVVPSLFAADISLSSTVGDDEVGALMWLRRGSGVGSVVMAPVHLGHHVSAIGRRANVIDSWFLLHDDAEERFDDVERVFSSVLETEVVSLFDKYGASYVIVPDGVNQVVFNSSDCFSLSYGNRTRVFRKDPSCRLRVVS